MASRSSPQPRRLSVLDEVFIEVHETLATRSRRAYKRRVPTDSRTLTPEQKRIAQLERENAALSQKLAEQHDAYARLQKAYRHALEQLQLLRKRLYVAKAERRDASAEQLAFDAMSQQVEQLEQALEEAEGADPGSNAADHADRGGKNDKEKKSPKGRRDLSKLPLAEKPVEVPDPELEGKYERIGVETSYRLGYVRGGPCKVAVHRIVYKVPGPTAARTSAEGTETTDSFDIITAPALKELSRRPFLAPSMIAHLLASKYLMGVPFYRLEQQFARLGVPLDRGTMCRYAEDTGATLGAIVQAAWKEAIETAFCLSTDATGTLIQPGPVVDRGGRGPCRKGHFFVVLADADHVFFEYQPKHTSAAVSEMFRGFTGYIHADAHAVYDAMFAGRTPRGAPPDEERGPPPSEVGCWSHARRKFWDAAVCKHPLGTEGLRRIALLFEADAKLSALSPAQRKVMRDTHVRPLVDRFFAWAKGEHARPRPRGLESAALGYVIRQESALRKFLEDGRLKMDNNSSERALRTIAVARKAWLFFGSDDHASAAANLFSLIASCKLHGIDPERYLAEIIRVMPYWPRDRYLELSPKYWVATRARLPVSEMAHELGPITVPAPLPAEQERTSG